jgi:metal-responsive CopG/Arc/MetJ family transcriptional regulator
MKKISMNLNGEYLEMVNFLKKKRGVVATSELIRILLTEEYERRRGERVERDTS